MLHLPRFTDPAVSRQWLTQGEQTAGMQQRVERMHLHCADTGLCIAFQSATTLFLSHMGSLRSIAACTQVRLKDKGAASNQGGVTSLGRTPHPSAA
jgi:hypothetical protein